MSFCGLLQGNKGARKRLVTNLLKLPRGRNELAGPYARYVIMFVLYVFVLLAYDT